MGKLVYLKDVTTLKVLDDKCIGCGFCLTVCPREVLRLNSGTVQIADRDSCIECGACARNCSVEAITVQAGVGCAQAIINAALGRKNGACCCTLETPSHDDA